MAPESAGVGQPAASERLRAGGNGGGLFFFGTSVCRTLLDDAAILDFRVGFGFCGGCWLWGPVGVHAEFLGQMHVSRLGCHVARAA